LIEPQIGILARTPGRQSSYRGELMGLYLACHTCHPHTTIMTDCAGAQKAVLNPHPPVQSADLLDPIRHLVSAKSLKVQKVKAHATDHLNNLCDVYAKTAAFLPPPAPTPPSSVWDVIRYGVLQHPPHKTWTHEAIPVHAHQGIHSISFVPLRHQNAAWFRWIFALQWAPGFSSYTTFWKQTVPFHSCHLCRRRHNQSVHGVMAFCRPHPLHTAWEMAWDSNQAVLQWLQGAGPQDTWLIGKAVIPVTLYHHLSTVVGSPQAKRIIRRFQSKFPPLASHALSFHPIATATSPAISRSPLHSVPTWLTPSLPPPPTPTRKRPFQQEDWMQTPRPPPSVLSMLQLAKRRKK
jgi:hypothetical protein